MSQMHSVTSPEQQSHSEEAVADMIIALSEHLNMSVPSVVYMIQQISIRYMAGWDKRATIKVLRLTARFINGDIGYDEFFKEQGKLVVSHFEI